LSKTGTGNVMKETEIDLLVRVKTVLDSLYAEGEDCVHPDTGLVVSDPEYDRLVARLAELDPKNPALKQLASTLSADAQKVIHNPPMTSISKAIGALPVRRQTLLDFFDECEKELGYSSDGNRGKRFVQTYKLDGVALALYYEKGKLVRAGLRPRDGINGEDVTENVKYVKGIPDTLSQPLTCSIRGELYCPISTFEKLNKAMVDAGEKPYANPRNYTTGSIRQFKDPTITKARQISFRAYSIIGLANPPYKTEIERAKWSNKVLGVPFVRVMPFDSQDLQKMEDAVGQIDPDTKKLLVDYEVDGIVISVDNLEDAEQMGTHGSSPNGNPRAKIAWKFTDEVGQGKVKEIELGIGRTGDVTPVLIFEKPVPLAGTNVTRCTAHNLQYLKTNKIGIGTVIEVIKSGKIIPKCHGVVSGETDWQHPANCPSCGGKFVIRQGGTGVALNCPNPFCGERAVSSIIHYLSTFGVKGLGDSTVEKLFAAGVVKTPADLYKLDDAAVEKAGFTGRQATLIQAAIWMVNKPSQYEDDELQDVVNKAKQGKPKIQMWQLLAAFGFQGIGKTSGRSLQSKFGTIDALRKAKVDDLTDIENFGEKTIQTLLDGLDNHAAVIDDVVKYVEVESPITGGVLAGQTFCFTGGFPNGKEHWMKLVEQAGGKCASSVSKKVNFVVVGADAGSKEQKADELGIKKLSLADLQGMLP
jgi:DNA ligase (NAD+)